MNLSLFASTDATFGSDVTLANTTFQVTNSHTASIVSYTATAADAGKFIGIVIDNDGSGSTFMGVDTVSLTATSVPEPTSMLLFAAGIVGLVLRRRGGGH